VRVLLVVHLYLPEHSAGVETYTDQLARELSRHAEVTVATTRKVISLPTGSVRRRAVRGIPVLEVINNLAHERFEDTWSNAAMERAFESILAEVRPDVVHFQHLMYWSWGLPRLARAAGARCLATLHDYWLICPRTQLIDFRGRLCAAPEESACAACTAHTPFGQPPAARRWITRLIAVRRATGVPLDRPMRWLAGLRPGRGPAHQRSEGEIDLSPWRAAYHERRRVMLRLAGELDLAVTPSVTLRDAVVAQGYPAERIRVVPQGLDPVDFAAVRREPSRGRLRLGFVGTLAPHKGVHVLVDAVRRLPPERIELRLWGPSSSHRDYAAQVRESARGHGHIHFLPALAKQDVPQAYRRIDVSCVPSLWNECCPLTILESLQARVPCVVSGRGGMAELIEDGVNGLHARPGDAADWERVLRRLIDEPQLLERLERGIRPVRTMQEHAAQIFSLYGPASA
jgi:glycosyltransferase involved in cell wall biosynthesis